MGTKPYNRVVVRGKLSPPISVSKWPLLLNSLISRKRGGFEDWDALNTRAAVWTGARIRADEGYAGLKRAFESGALLPAAILAVLSPALLSSSDDGPSRETT